MSNEIILDKKYFESLKVQFEAVFEKTDAASKYAYRIDRDITMCNLAHNANENTRQIIQLILDSFTTADEKMKKEAQEIIGVEIHNGISAGGRAIIDANGECTIQSKYEAYCIVVDQIDSIQNRPRQIQIRRCTSAGFNSNLGGICNISSVTTLLNRKYAYDHGSEAADYFTAEDAFKANGCTNIKFHGHSTSGDHPDQDYYQYNGGTDGWANKTYSNGSDASYTTHSISAATARNDVNKYYGGSYKEYVAHLLEEHPEGICIRNAKSEHVAVITGYTRDENNNIKIQVEDPVGNYKGDLEGAHIYKNDSNKKNFWNHLDNNIAFTYLS